MVAERPLGQRPRPKGETDPYKGWSRTRDQLPDDIPDARDMRHLGIAGTHKTKDRGRKVAAFQEGEGRGMNDGRRRQQAKAACVQKRDLKCTAHLLRRNDRLHPKTRLHNMPNTDRDGAQQTMGWPT